MSLEKRLIKRKKRRKLRVRGNLKSGQQRPRVSVFRSLKNISAQIIDDSGHKTVATFSSVHLKDAKGDKTSIAKKVGLELAKLAQSKSVVEVFFDRGPYKYHGRVRALAEGLREGGLKF